MTCKKVAIILVALMPCSVFAEGDRNWSGFRFGSHIGAGRINNAGPANDMTTFGIQILQFWDQGTVVLGASLAYDNLRVQGIADNDNHYTRGQVLIGYDAGQWLPYATAGYASLTFRGGAPRRSDQGGLLGAGVSYALADDTELRAEVLHHFNDDFYDLGADRSGDHLSLAYDYRF